MKFDAVAVRISSTAAEHSFETTSNLPLVSWCSEGTLVASSGPFVGTCRARWSWAFDANILDFGYGSLFKATATRFPRLLRRKTELTIGVEKNVLK